MQERCSAYCLLNSVSKLERELAEIRKNTGDFKGLAFKKEDTF
jgi:hypothetical protein